MLKECVTSWFHTNQSFLEYMYMYNERNTLRQHFSHPQFFSFFTSKIGNQTKKWFNSEIDKIRMWQYIYITVPTSQHWLNNALKYIAHWIISLK